MIITISGYHGTGKTTYAARLAKHLGLRHVSAGMLFRRLAKERGISLEAFGQMALKDPTIDRIIDDHTMSEAEKGDVVIDGQITGWVLKEVAHLRILLTTPDPIRIKRIAERDRLTIEEAKRQTNDREKIQSERYKVHYGFKVEDRTIYQLILDTSIGTIDTVTKILVDTAEAASTTSQEKRGRRAE